MFPGYSVTEDAAEIERGLVQWQVGGRCPQLKVVALAVAPMAVLAADRHVDGEGSAASGRGVMQRAGSVPLAARSA